MQLSNEIRLTGLLSDGHGTRAQAHDLDLPDCELCGHPIPNGQEYVLMKFLRGERYAILHVAPGERLAMRILMRTPREALDEGRSTRSRAA